MRLPVSDVTWTRALVLIVGVAILLRIGLVVATTHFTPWGDPSDYERHAASIALGYGYPASGIASPGTASAFRPPAYPYLLGAAYALFGVHVVVGRLLSAGLGVVVVVLLAYLGKAVWGRRVGLLAAALAAVYLPLIGLNATVLSEPLFLVLELLVALVLVKLARDPSRIGWAGLAGGLCALAALTRSVGIVLVLTCLAIVAFSKINLRRRAGSMGAAVVGLVVVLTPWTIRNARTFHAFLPIATQDGFTLAGQYNDQAGHGDRFQAVWRVPLQVPSIEADVKPLYLRRGGVNEAELDARFRQLAFSYFCRHPSQLFISTWLNSIRMLDLGLNHSFTTTVAYREMGLPTKLWRATTLSAQLIVLLCVLGLVARSAGAIGYRLGPYFLWAVPMLILAVTVPSVGGPRYRAPADPFLLLLAAAVIAGTIERIAVGHKPDRSHVRER